jgi:hypothetical protein
MGLLKGGKKVPNIFSKARDTCQMLSSSHSTSPDPALSLVKATTACREDWIYRQWQKMPRKTAGESGIP